MAEAMFHYTDSAGHKAISAGPTWKFKAAKPPGNRPVGAYFTTLEPGSPTLAKRLRIPKRKLEYVFSFSGDSGLEPLKGARGRYVFWSPTDYNVGKARQIYHGRGEDFR
jgi:hypothetical protein